MQKNINYNVNKECLKILYKMIMIIKRPETKLSQFNE